MGRPRKTPTAEKVARVVIIATVRVGTIDELTEAVEMLNETLGTLRGVGSAAAEITLPQGTIKL